VPGEGVTRSEPGNPGHLADELGGAHRGDAVDLAQLRGNGGGSLVELGLERVDLDRQCPDPLDQVPGNPRHHGVQPGEAVLGLVQVLHRGERAVLRRPSGVDVVQVPAKPVDVPGPLRDQVLAVVDQQT
jgi:hypothetical protein